LAGLAAGRSDLRYYPDYTKDGRPVVELRSVQPVLESSDWTVLQP